MSPRTPITGRRMPRLAAAAIAVVVATAAPLAAVADEAAAGEAAVGEDAVVALEPVVEEAAQSEEAAPEKAAVATVEAVDPAPVPADVEVAETGEADASASIADAPPASDETSSTSSAATPVPVLAADEEAPQEAGPNHAPVAVDDFYVVSQDTTLVVSFPGIKDNDYDPDGDWFQLPDRTDPLHGTLTSSNAHGSFTYVPDPGFVGIDSYQYWAADEFGAESAMATVTIEVKAAGIPVDVPPIAVDDVYYYAVNTPLYISPGILANDELHGDDAVISIENKGSNWGVATLDPNPDGSFLFTPAPDQGGTRWIEYRVCTVGGCSVAGLRLEYWEDKEPSGPSEPPAQENHSPEANADMASVVEGEVKAFAAPGVLGNDSDADGDVLAVVGHMTPAHGTIVMNADGSYAYAAEPGYVGAVDVEYTMTDGTSEATANLRIEVHPKPIAEPGEGCPPNAVAQPCEDDGDTPEQPSEPAGATDPAQPGEPTIPEQPQAHGSAVTGLAQTGADSTLGILAALFALSAGAALLSIRRRTQRR